MKVISLFDYTGEAVKPWRDAGYRCHCYDIQHKGVEFRDGIYYHYADLSKPFEIEGPVAFLFGFPPCTDLACSGARWMKGKGLRALQESIGLFATSAEMAEASGAPYLIENPRSTISTYWRAPDFTFHPAQYSGYVDGEEFYTKETNLWTGGGYVHPPRRMAPDMLMPDQTYIHHQPPGPERANIRSATPRGFAQAVFEANHRDHAKGWQELENGLAGDFETGGMR